MIFFPTAKINIGLHILEKRRDGYHEIESLLFPIGLEDSLEFIESNQMSLEVHIPGDVIGREWIREPELEGDNNLILKAYHLLAKDYSLPKLSFYLMKNIPMGAGLGGGSSDAAGVLVWINKVYKLGINIPGLKQYAEQLGSDCPFFVENLSALAKGRGEILEHFPIDLTGMYLVLVKPPISISTKEAYSLVKPSKPLNSLKEILNRPIDQWKECLFNDFEKALFPPYPQLEWIKNELYDKGAIYASMSGSGSTLYGIFPKEIIEKLNLETWMRGNRVFLLPL